MFEKLTTRFMILALIALLLAPISQASYNTLITEAQLSFTDITTSNASSTKHGLVPKLSNSATTFFNGTGGFTTPAFSSTVLAVSGAGYALLPAGPAVGTIVTPGSANTYGSYTQMREATGNAVYIVAVLIQNRQLVGSTSCTYVQVAIGTGTAASETQVSEVKIQAPLANDQVTQQIVTLPFPIPVAASTRIAVKSAISSTDGTKYDTLITLMVVDQSNIS